MKVYKVNYCKLISRNILQSGEILVLSLSAQNITNWELSKIAFLPKVLFRFQDPVELLELSSSLLLRLLLLLLLKLVLTVISDIVQPQLS